MSLLGLCEILRLFVNILTHDDKYSFCNNDKLQQPIQIELSRNKKLFSFISSIYINFWIKKHVEKKMTLIAYMFRKLLTAKNAARKMSKESRFRTPFESLDT